MNAEIRSFPSSFRTSFVCHWKDITRSFLHLPYSKGIVFIFSGPETVFTYDLFSEVCPIDPLLSQNAGTRTGDGSAFQTAVWDISLYYNYKTLSPYSQFVIHHNSQLFLCRTAAYLAFLRSAVFVNVILTCSTFYSSSSNRISFHSDF